MPASYEAKEEAKTDASSVAGTDDATLVKRMADFAKLNFLGNFVGCVTVSCEESSFQTVMEILNKDGTDKIFGAFGIHPHYAEKYIIDGEFEKKLVEAMKHPRVVAWGECGLDYFRPKGEAVISDEKVKAQRSVFERQMNMAVQCKKTLVVHSRNADEDTVELMLKTMPKDWNIHLHCCTSTIKMVEPLLANFINLKVGFTGCITYPEKDDVRETLKKVPLNRLLLETDAPNMTPVPFRGSIAHPGMIPITAAKMAELKGVTVEKLLEQVLKNVSAVYGINFEEGKSAD